MKKRIAYLLCLLMLLHGDLHADVIKVAVASNFAHTLKKLAADFKIKTGHELRITSGSSGKLYAQIKHGAPYDVFLSADEKRPDLLIKQGIADSASSYVYALGELVLLSNIELTGGCENILYSERMKWLAIANPNIAPYGIAAKQVLQKLLSWERLQPRLVMGENIAQTFQFVSTKNAEAGFVARSMVLQASLNADQKLSGSCIWDVPPDMYLPIKQKMVVLDKAKHDLVVQAFVQYMHSSAAKEIIIPAGYAVL